MSMGHPRQSTCAFRNAGKGRALVVVAVAAVISLATPASAQPVLGSSVGDPAPAAAGRRIVERDCAGCHAIGPKDASPFSKAPPFRDLHLKYDLEDLAESLAEGIVAGHPAMPERTYEPSDIAALIAYLKSLSPAADGGAEKPAP